jgi:cyclase
VSTFRTRQLVAGHASRLGPALEQSRASLAALRERAAKGEEGAEEDARAAAARLDALEGLEIVPPDLSFEKKLTLHGAQRRAEVLSFGGGHTSSDAFVWIPDARVLISGDLVSVGARHVWAGDGNPGEWTRILGEMSVLGPEAVIPGHGSVGTATDLATFTRYMGALAAVIEKAIAAEASPEDIEVLTPPEAHRENVMWFRRSAHALVNKALGRAAP